ncbi:hypothetical protein ACFXGA_31560 [Actinosynnema sp. NPDC059335]|uniref:hypothetical protein n=1 Tax=Actinosynnema sp. NPDC059335 TaxID=3346804 RepID=UPI003671D31E
MRIAAVLAALIAVLAASTSPAPVVRHGEGPAPRPVAGIRVSYQVDGVTRIAKLQSDLVIGPGRLDAEIDLASGTITGDLWLPPADGYFVVFGFVPTTARTTLTPVGRVSGTISEGQVEARAEVDIGLGDVAVNEQPLDAGPACATAEPASLGLAGPFELAQMRLTGVYAIPSFGNCLGRERLDPLFTGLISGPGNAIDLTLTLLPTP